MRDCTVDPATHCTHCPATPAIEGVPAHVEYRPNFGWNKGGNSITEYDGDVRLVFTMPASSIGTVVGFRQKRTGVGLPDAHSHAFLFQSASGIDVFSIIEDGVVVFGPVARYVDTTEYSIQRRRQAITYLVGGEVAYASPRLCWYDPVITGGGLYASTDSIG